MRYTEYVKKYNICNTKLRIIYIIMDTISQYVYLNLIRKRSLYAKHSLTVF